jgi:hypothetical protein
MTEAVHCNRVKNMKVQHRKGEMFEGTGRWKQSIKKIHSSYVHKPPYHYRLVPTVATKSTGSCFSPFIRVEFSEEASSYNKQLTIKTFTKLFAAIFSTVEFTYHGRIFAMN